MLRAGTRSAHNFRRALGLSIVERRPAPRLECAKKLRNASAVDCAQQQEEKLIKKSRLVVSMGLCIALTGSAFAFATGATDNQPAVDGQITPTKLDKKKYKPISLFSGVRTTFPGGSPNGTQSNAVSEFISYPKNIKFDFDAGSVCTTLPPSGSTTQQARDACPADSYLGAGVAEVQGPGIAPITDIVVSVFRGPDKNGIQLHTYSPTLGQAAPTVLGQIVSSGKGGEFGQALSVPHAPETGALAITKFNANIEKSSKAVTAVCKDKTMTFQRDTTWADGTTSTSNTTQNCTQKKPKKHHHK
jgi:hypothetical protein